MKNGAIKILSIDAKDLYLSNNYKNVEHNGYNIKNRNGEVNVKKFINVLDYSLDLIKLRSVYEKIYRNTNFTFNKGIHEYGTSVINVTFKYSVKEFNKINRFIYLKIGYCLDDAVWKDGVWLENEELIAIDTSHKVESPISENLLGKYFKFENDKYVEFKSPKTVLSASELREWLYSHGCLCNNTQYVRFKRSSGSSRQGKCLFIDKKLYNKMHKWEMCGIKIKDNQDVDLAALEAYISLTTSSIIDLIEINPENILVIDDFDSVFYENAIETRIDSSVLLTEENNVEIRNSIWDGQSLMDISLFGKYKNKGMLLLRNQFFKSCCFNSNIKQWFKDHNITDVSQLNGFTLAKNINDIKMITTPNSIKYLKFGTLEQWLNNIDPLFGIVKYEKETHNFDGRMVQSHYQLLNTLQLTYDEVFELVKPSLEYLNLIRDDFDVLKFHIKYPMQDNSEFTSLNSKNDIIYKLLSINKDFSKTKLYYDFKSDLTKSYIKNLRCGHILIEGNYSTMCGNPIEMLQHSIGKFDGKSQIGIGCIYSTRFGFNKEILGSRSPHVTMGNIWLPKNRDNDLIKKYLNSTNEIVYVNSIGESVLDRLSGSDYDSDTVLLTDNKTLIKSAKKNYHMFKVPVNHVDSIKRKRKFTQKEKADLDIKTGNNKIGEIINLSQELNTILWENINNGETYERVKKLYYDICQLDVMSNLEIDKAKKEFVVNTYEEMKKIKQKWIGNIGGKHIKPNFFSHLAKQKGYYKIGNKVYKFHNTTMDYLQHIINSYIYENRKCLKNEFLKFSELIDYDGADTNHKVYYEQVSRVISLIEKTSLEINKIFSNVNLCPNEKYILSDEVRQECVEYIGNLKFSRSTMVYILRLIETDRYKHLRIRMFNILFGYPNISFFEVIKQIQEPQNQLVECADGDIKIFDFKYKKHTKNAKKLSV